MSTPSPTPQPAPSPVFAATQPYAGQPTGFVLPSGYPAAGQPDGTAPRRNTVGLISLILGLVLVAWMFVNLILQAQAIATGTAPILIGTVSTIVNGTVALGAVGTGIAGIASRSPRKIAAGLGTGMGIMALAGTLSGLLYPVLFQLLAAF